MEHGLLCSGPSRSNEVHAVWVERSADGTPYFESRLGEIRDEFDETTELAVPKAAPGETIIDGATSIGDVNDRFGTTVPDADYTTIGGYVFGALGLYPAIPGTDVLVLGSPLFDAATVRLDGGRELRIVGRGAGRDRRRHPGTSYAPR